MKAAIAILLCQAQRAYGQQPVSGPHIRVFKTVGEQKLTAHIFQAAGIKAGERRPGVVLFHGGGGVAGSPDWVYEAAKRYTSFGAIAVAAEYRLSEEREVTPLDAMADARDIVKWVRRNASELHLDGEHIVAYGVSAGGQLAAARATFPDPEKTDVSAMPDAMVMISPAVAVGQDGWFQHLLGEHGSSKEISSDMHVGRGMPPTIIFNGNADTLTPAADAKRFGDAISNKGKECELHTYEGVGHLFTRKLDSQESDFDPDPKVVSDRRSQGDQFLAQHGFLPHYVVSPSPTNK
jgi:acetyl esterase/lipase